ncbi:hypothetical protein VPH35_053963 [Triticum aestivum]
MVIHFQNRSQTLHTHDSVGCKSDTSSYTSKIHGAAASLQLLSLSPRAASPASTPRPAAARRLLLDRFPVRAAPPASARRSRLRLLFCQRVCAAASDSLRATVPHVSPSPRTVLPPLKAGPTSPRSSADECPALALPGRLRHPPCGLPVPDRAGPAPPSGSACYAARSPRLPAGSRRLGPGSPRLSQPPASHAFRKIGPAGSAPSGFGSPTPLRHLRRQSLSPAPPARGPTPPGLPHAGSPPRTAGSARHPAGPAACRLHPQPERPASPAAPGLAPPAPTSLPSARTRGRVLLASSFLRRSGLVPAAGFASAWPPDPRAPLLRPGRIPAPGGRLPAWPTSPKAVCRPPRPGTPPGCAPAGCSVQMEKEPLAHWPA